MIPNAWQGFDFGLGEDIDMLRETTRGFAAGQDRAARRRDRQDQHLPARSVAADGRARPARHHRRGGIRRLGARLSRPLRGDGGNLAGLGLGRPVLRRALQSLRQPDPAHRHRRPAPEISAEADFRRACRRAWPCRSPAPAPTWCRCAPAPTRRATATSSTARNSGSPTARWPRRWWSMPRPTRTPARAASPPS